MDCTKDNDPDNESLLIHCSLTARALVESPNAMSGPRGAQQLQPGKFVFVLIKSSLPSSPSDDILFPIMLLLVCLTLFDNGIASIVLGATITSLPSVSTRTPTTIPTATPSIAFTSDLSLGLCDNFFQELKDTVEHCLGLPRHHIRL